MRGRLRAGGRPQLPRVLTNRQPLGRRARHRRGGAGGGFPRRGRPRAGGGLHGARGQGDLRRGGGAERLRAGFGLLRLLLPEDAPLPGDQDRHRRVADHRAGRAGCATLPVRVNEFNPTPLPKARERQAI